tara:strand:+ start:3051 stop:3422 length:372 start_codon:yes stop_codon:yes gene_type:complete
MRKCGNCGQPGHYRSTCTRKRSPKPVDPVVEQIEEEDVDYEEVLCDENWKPLKKEKNKKPIICTVCGDEGHNEESCYYSKPPPDVIGPTIMECGHFTWWMEDGECSRCNRRQNLKEQPYEAAA